MGGIYPSRRRWGQERSEAQVGTQMEEARGSRSGGTADGYELVVMSCTSGRSLQARMMGTWRTER